MKNFEDKNQIEEEKTLKSEVEDLGKKREKAMEEYRGERKEFSEESDEYFVQGVAKLCEILKCEGSGELIKKYPILKKYLNARSVLGLIEIAKCVGDEEDSVEFFGRAFPLIADVFSDDNLRPDLIKMAKYSNGHATMLLETVFLKTRKLFYNDKLRPDLVKVVEYLGKEAVYFFQEEFHGVKKEFEDDKLRPDLLKLIKHIGHAGDARYFFKRGFPEIREEFKDDKLRPYLIKMTEYAEASAGYVFYSGFPKIREEFKNDKLRPDLVKLIEHAGENAGLLFRDGFPQILEEFYDDKLRPDLLKMAKYTGRRAGYLFANGFPKIREDFHNDKLRPDLMKMVKSMREGSDEIFAHSFNLIESEFHDDKLRPDLVKLVEYAGEGAYELVGALYKVNKEFCDDKLRPDLMKMGELAGVDVGYLFGGFDNLREEFHNDRLRPDLIKMVKDTGRSVSLLFRYCVPGIREKFNKGGYAEIKDYWNDLIKLAGIMELQSFRFFSAFHRITGEMADDKLRPDLIKLVEDSEKHPVAFIIHGIPRIREEFHKGGYEATKDFAKQFAKLPRGINYGIYCNSVQKLGQALSIPFMETFTLLGKFVSGESDRLSKTINEFYKNGSRDLRPLKSTLDALNVLGGDEVRLFIEWTDLDQIFGAFKTGNVEEKVLVSQAILPYMQNKDKERLVNALDLTKEQINIFLGVENDRPKRKLSNYYYIIKGYELLGDDEAKKEVLSKIDFEKIMKERMGLEVFGLLEELNAPNELWEKIINTFSLNLGHLKAVERVRKKLLLITYEKANQIIELKAKEYVEEPITNGNLKEKVSFVKIWGDPDENAEASGLDDRFVFDIYVFAAKQMKNSLKRYASDNYVEGYAEWGIFDKEDAGEIDRIQTVFRKQKEEETKRKEEEERLNRIEKEKKEREERLRKEKELKSERERAEMEKQKNMEDLRDWILSHSTVAEVKGRISNRGDLQNRLDLYLGFKAEGLTGRMEFIREQIVSYINRMKKTAVNMDVKWKGKNLKLRDVLPDLEIVLVESADNLGARIRKLFDPDIDDDYKKRKIEAKASHKARMLKESLFGAGNAELVPGKLQFESGFSGGGENYGGRSVELTNEQVHSSTKLYTVKRSGNTEAIIAKFDPKEGARFKFLVQVGATTGGNKNNLSKILRGKYGKKLMMDTVGSMVQGAGMPISMIFENGETKNKKTTMEGQRDGLVIFSPGGRMAVVKKTKIHYWEMAQVARLKAFRTKLNEDIKQAEMEFEHLLPQGAEITKSFEQENKDIIRKYRKLLEIQELFNQWKAGKPLNYASEESYLHQELFWMVSKHSKLSGFLESLYVENGKSMSNQQSAAHKRLLMKFYDGTFGIYDSRIPMTDAEVSDKIIELVIDGKKVQFAVNLDTGMADDTRIYDKNGKHFQVGYTSQPVGTNRIGIWHKDQR
ncbi:hypothetical protein KJ632_01885 [Patescibacteria group bacterium]|nr:hypothetical protein [Patescibacteria group bacterium]